MIKISEYLPDQFNFEQGSRRVQNVVPRARSYSPFPSFAVYSANALTNRAQGAAAFRSNSNAIGHYAGDATKLYRLVGGTTWTDASGSAYTTGADNVWNFAQFGQLAIAVNGVNPPQKITLGSGTNFANLGGSPPTARYIAVVRDFLFLGNLGTDAQSVQWSAINNAEGWTIGTDQSDIQPIPDGGWVQGIVGGEFGLVFGEFAINRFTYAGGDIIFQRDQLTNGIGATISGTVAGYGNQAFCCHRTGFYMVVNGQEIRAIGAERVNNFFWSSLNQNYLHRVTSAIDPENNLYVVSYPNTESTDGTPNELLVYNWFIDRWSRVFPGPHEMIYNGLTANQVTLEELSAAYPDLETVPYSLDSQFWTGVGRLLLSSFEAANHFGTSANGPSLAALVDMSEVQLANGRQAFLKSVRPMVDASNASITVSVRTRNRLEETAAPPLSFPVDNNGRANFRSVARYHRLRVEIAAGAVWSHMIGVDELNFSPAGRR